MDNLHEIALFLTDTVLVVLALAGWLLLTGCLWAFGRSVVAAVRAEWN